MRLAVSVGQIDGLGACHFQRHSRLLTLSRMVRILCTQQRCGAIRG